MHELIRIEEYRRKLKNAKTLEEKKAIKDAFYNLSLEAKEDDIRRANQIALKLPHPLKTLYELGRNMVLMAKPKRK